METTDDRLRRLEIESICFRETIWEITKRLAIVETLVRSHVLQGSNSVPADRLFGSIPQPQQQPDSAAVTDLVNRLSNLEMLVQNVPCPKPPLSNGVDPFTSTQKAMGNEVGSGSGGGSLPFRFPATMIPGFVHGGEPRNNLNDNNLQRVAPFPTDYNKNNNRKDFEKLLLPSGPSSNSILEAINHPKSVDKHGQDILTSRENTTNTATAADNKTGATGVSNPSKVIQSTHLPVEPKPTPCGKLCGKFTGHACGQIHNVSASCPPCKFFMKELKLKCGHKTDIHCYVKNSKDFKCFQCENTNNLPQVSKPPFPVESSNSYLGEEKLAAQPLLVEPKNSGQPDEPEKKHVESEGSWMDVDWGDEDEISTSIPPQPKSTTSSTSATVTAFSEKNGNGLNTAAVLGTTSNANFIPPVSISKPLEKLMKVDAQPLTYVQSVTVNSQLSSASTSSTRTNSPAPLKVGSSITPGAKFNVGLIVTKYMKKYFDKSKAVRKEWLQFEFQSYSKNQLNAFLREVIRHSVKLSRGAMAGTGQLISGLIELQLTTMELVIQAYLMGIISDLPQIQKEDASKFEAVGDSLCYILVATFTEDKDLTWLVTLGQSMQDTKPAIWAVISTTIIHTLVDRKRQLGFAKLYHQTNMNDKSSILSKALKAARIVF